MKFYYLFFCVSTLTRIIKDDAFNKSIHDYKAHKFFLDGSSQSKNFIAFILVIMNRLFAVALQHSKNKLNNKKIFKE